MANFEEHIQQSKSNLKFLTEISNKTDGFWDWQVTVCFYSALHLINAHIVKKMGRNYLSHSIVDEIINPYNQLSLAKLNEEIYISYTKLFQLSRRSRYLIHTNKKKRRNKEIQPVSLTYSKHLQKAVYHLEVIMNYFQGEYKVKFEKVKIDCIDLKGRKFQNFIT